MSEIVFEVLCAEVLEALRGLGLGKFSIRNYYYEGMRPIIKAYRSEGVIFYSIPFTSEVVDRFRAEHENGLVSDLVWMSIRKVKALFEEYTLYIWMANSKSDAPTKGNVRMFAVTSAVTPRRSLKGKL